MKIIYNTLLILVIFISYPTFGQNAFKSIKVDSDTIKASFIRDIINNDSISILEFQKIKYPDMPGQVDERLVYVDYKKSALAEEIKKSRDQLSKIFLGESYFIIQRTIEKEYIINPYKEISNTYIEIHKLNNEYILFLPDFDHLKMITDSAFIYKDDEGLLFYYFNDISKSNNMYEIKYRDFQRNICQIAIQWYDKNKNILIWKETHLANNNEFTNYRLYIPLNKAINYPFLNIINTAGLDDIYDKFDKNYLNK